MDLPQRAHRRSIRQAFQILHTGGVLAPNSITLYYLASYMTHE